MARRDGESRSEQSQESKDGYCEQRNKAKHSSHDKSSARLAVICEAHDITSSAVVATSRTPSLGL